MDRRALITGITGQTGSYLAELLLGEGYEVHGIVRRSSSFNTSRIDHLYRDPHEETNLFLHYGDLLDASSLSRILMQVKPDEVYNLAAQSHVAVSFELPVYTVDTVALGNLRMLEAVREYNRGIGYAKLYQASSSEIFGSSAPPQSIDTPLRPMSPYAVAKVAAYHQTRLYRDAYGLFACNGILFNHESPRRLETFVTRKITRAVGRIKHGLQDKLYLGNLEARRDWGHARDYAGAIWRIMQHDEPGDFVICTGESHSVREFCELAFGIAELDWKRYVEVDPRYIRPAEVEHLRGDPTYAKDVLGWEAETIFGDLVIEMVLHDLRLAQREASG